MKQLQHIARSLRFQCSASLRFSLILSARFQAPCSNRRTASRSPAHWMLFGYRRSISCRHRFPASENVGRSSCGNAIGQVSRFADRMGRKRSANCCASPCSSELANDPSIRS
jgi:hypothetical protein